MATRLSQKFIDYTIKFYGDFPNVKKYLETSNFNGLIEIANLCKKTEINKLSGAGDKTISFAQIITKKCDEYIAMVQQEQLNQEYQQEK